MRILALDPGSTETGVVLLDAAPPAQPLQHGTYPNADVLEFITGYLYDALVIESVPAVYGRDALPDLCEAIRWEGRYIERAAARGRGPCLVPRAKVKAALCGAANVKDSAIRAELIYRWGGNEKLVVGTKKAPGPLHGFAGDDWAALAIAVWALENVKAAA